MINLINNTKMQKIERKRIVKFSATRVLRDFVQNTSIHGIKYLDSDSPGCGKIGQFFWIWILIVAFAGSWWLLKLFWDRYQAHPILTVMEDFYTPSFLTTYPGLTVCPMIAPDLETRANFLRRIKLPNGTNEERAMFLFKEAFEMSHPRADMYEERNELNEILKLNNINLVDLLASLRSPCENVVESCWWDNERVNCFQIFRRSYTFGGLCCSFNYLLEDQVDPLRKGNMPPTKTAINYGVHSGVTLIFTGDQFIINDDNGNIERITTNTVGLLLFIHPSMVYPDTSSLILQAGREMQLRISAKENKKVPGLGGEHEIPCSSEDSKIEYFDEYWKVNCHNSCRIRASLALCNCVPWLFAPFVDKTFICDFSQMKCLRINYRQIWSVMYINESVVECFCPMRCNEQHYQVTHSQIPLSEKLFAPSLIYRNASMENAVLRMYIGEQVYDRAASLKIADEIYLLSSVGGIFSLFLGCSILSLGEIIYFAYILIASWIMNKMPKEDKNKTRKIKKKILHL